MKTNKSTHIDALRSQRDSYQIMYDKLNSDISEQNRIQYESCKKIEQLEAEIRNVKELVEKYNKMLTNEMLPNIIGKYVIYSMYREDTKLGNVNIGKITSMRDAIHYNYEGVKLNYYGESYDDNFCKNFEVIYPNSIKYNRENNCPYCDWIPAEHITNGLYKVISEEEYTQHRAFINLIINRHNV